MGNARHKGFVQEAAEEGQGTESNVSSVSAARDGDDDDADFLLVYASTHAR